MQYGFQLSPKHTGDRTAEARLSAIRDGGYRAAYQETGGRRASASASTARSQTSTCY